MVQHSVPSRRRHIGTHKRIQPVRTPRTLQHLALDNTDKVTRVKRVEAPRHFLPNVRSSGLALRLALAKGMNSEQIWPGTRNFAKLKLLMFHVRVFLLDAP